MKYVLCIFSVLFFANFAMAEIPKQRAEVFKNVSTIKLKSDKEEKRTGKVLETSKLDPYTVMLIEDKGSKIWIAAPAFEVKVGDIVETSLGNMMKNFESKTLKKKFDEIYFVTFAKVVTPIENPHKSAVMSNISSVSKKIESIKGSVLDVKNLDPYILLEVDMDKTKYYVAAPKMEIAVGDIIEASSLTVMNNFLSKTLDKKFDVIYFAQKASVVKQKSPKKKLTKHYGKVLDTFDVDIYTYIQVDEAGEKVWLAVNKIAVKKGDKIEAPLGIMMTNFKSKTLNRTFDKIYFVEKITVNPKQTKKPKTKK